MLQTDEGLGSFFMTGRLEVTGPVYPYYSNCSFEHSDCGSFTRSRESLFGVESCRRDARSFLITTELSVIGRNGMV